MSEILIKKENGRLEKFNIKKLEKSLKKSGANKELIENICKKVECEIKDGFSSSKIYNITRKLLENFEDKKAFLRYNLPNAISKLGPEGFAFEKFIGEVFESYNYSPVFVGKKIAGKCIQSHEMDIVAFKGNDHVTAELKFHNSRSKKSELKVALYMKARFDDIESSGYYGNKNPRKMIITNTKFTANAKKYSACSGIEVLSWNYPEGKNLHDFILKSEIHPLTALNSITQKAKEYFIKRKIVSCRGLLKNDMKALKENMYVPKDSILKIKDEISQICGFSKTDFNSGKF